MASTKPGRPPKKACRPKGPGKPYTLETQLRAKQIYQESQGTAGPAAIARQLAKEGYEPAPDAVCVARWKHSTDWESPIHSPVAADISEEVRQAVQLHLPDDLQRIEQSCTAFEMLTQSATSWLRERVKDIKIETAEDFEIMTRSLRELMHTQMSATKAVQDLRLLRISSLSGMGEVIPPTRPDMPPMASEQERVISNF